MPNSLRSCEVRDGLLDSAGFLPLVNFGLMPDDQPGRHSDGGEGGKKSQRESQNQWLCDEATGYC